MTKTRVVAGEIYDTGLFSVTVPDEMFSKPSQNVFSVVANAIDPKDVYVASTNDEWYYNAPYKEIYHYGFE